MTRKAERLAAHLYTPGLEHGPHLLRRIRLLNQGEEAVEPLLALVARVGPSDPVLPFAIRVLGHLQVDEAIPLFLPHIRSAGMADRLRPALVDAFLYLGPDTWPGLRELIAERLSNPPGTREQQQAYAFAVWAGANLARRYPEAEVILRGRRQILAETVARYDP